MPQWEHTYVAVSTNDMGTAMNETNRLGAEGWEVVGIASADKTIGLNSNLMVLKREVVPPVEPPTVDPGWYADPCGRFDKRYWDGRAWTAHVATESSKSTSIDPPTILAAATAGVG